MAYAILYLTLLAPHSPCGDKTLVIRLWTLHELEMGQVFTQLVSPSRVRCVQPRKALPLSQNN